MEWYESKRTLPNDGEKVLGIRPRAYDRSRILDIYTFEEIQDNAITYMLFTDCDGNSYTYDEVTYWTPIENIPQDIKL